MKVKVNFKKPTVMLTADKYSSMLKEMEDMRGVVARKDAEVVERNALIQELNDQIEASETARKDAEDALVIAKKNATLREMGWDMLHKQIEELQRENRGLRMQVDRAEKRAEDAICELDSAKQTIATLREFREELGEEVDEANRVIAEMATELTLLKGELAQKNKINDTSFKAANDLAELLVAAQKERDEAREEAGNYRVELMERDCRVDELEKRVEWLESELEQAKQTADSYQCVAIAYQEDLENLRVTHTELTLKCERWKESATENLEIAKDYHKEALKAEEEAKRIKEAYDTLYERSADNYANAQYWEEQAHKLEEEIDTLRRQLKANEETYMALRAMYEELRDAATGLVSHIRTNTFAN